MILITGMTPIVTDDRDEFHKMQDDLTRASWVGFGCTRELPGGGNADNDGDTDGIEQHKPATRVIVGPKSFIDGSNK